MDFHKKETQKYLIPIGLALAGFIVAVISILFGYFYLPNLGAAFFRLILACVLPVILLLMYQSKSAAKTALPLMVIGAVLLGLQLLGTLYTLFAAIAGAGFGLFRWIPGSSILGHLVLALAYFFDCFSWGFYFFRISLSSSIGALSELLFLLSNLFFLAICSEYQPFSLLNSLRDSLYRALNLPMTNLEEQSGSAENQQPGPQVQSEAEPEPNQADFTSQSTVGSVPPPPADGIPALLLTPKSIPLSLLLSFLTCGIYSLVWVYGIMKRIRLLCRDYNGCVGEFLCFFLVPFYSYYWYYTRAKKLSAGANSYGVYCSDNCIIYLLLAIFGFSIINTCLMQNDLNNVAHALAGNATYSGPTAPSGGYTTPSGGYTPPTGVADPSADPIEQLQKLNNLRKSGAISEEEFQQKKQELLKRI